MNQHFTHRFRSPIDMQYAFYRYPMLYTIWSRRAFLVLFYTIGNNGDGCGDNDSGPLQQSLEENTHLKRYGSLKMCTSGLDPVVVVLFLMYKW